MNYTTSKMYSCHLSDCGLTVNSVYIRMFVFVCFHRRYIANSFESLRAPRNVLCGSPLICSTHSTHTLISCARAEHARVRFVPGKTEPNLLLGCATGSPVIICFTFLHFCYHILLYICYYKSDASNKITY